MNQNHPLFKFISQWKAKNLTLTEEHKDKLIESVKDHNIEKIQELIKRFQISTEAVTDKKGNTLLALAVIMNDSEMVKFLLQYGIDPNSQNEDGNTALHYAVSGRKLKIIDLLILNGADERIKNNLGQEPWQLEHFFR